MSKQQPHKAPPAPKAPAAPKPPGSSKKGAPKKDKGTQRWPAACVKDGDWFQLPKSVVQNMVGFDTPGAFKFKPHHLWLILALQADRYRDRIPRYYWEELAEWAGVDKNTVRRWGYELRDAGLLEIKQNRKVVSEGNTRRVGYRNERNEFILGPFEVMTAQIHKTWKDARRKRGDGSGKKPS